MIWCLHGAMGQANDWDSFAAEMASRGYACRAVDLWRFLECEGMSLEDWAEYFNSEVRAVESESNILIGYSMGGRLGLHALLADPSLWCQSVIVSAHPGLQSDEERLERMASDAEWAGGALTAEWVDFLKLWDGQEVLQERGREELSKYDSRQRLINRRRAIARSFMEWSLGKQRDLRDELPKVAKPLLWLTGEHDQKFTGLAHEVVPRLERGEHQVIPDSGHRVPWEAPAAFTQAVLAAIEREVTKVEGVESA